MSRIKDIILDRLVTDGDRFLASDIDRVGKTVNITALQFAEYLGTRGTVDPGRLSLLFDQVDSDLGDGLEYDIGGFYTNSQEFNSITELNISKTDKNDANGIELLAYFGTGTIKLTRGEDYAIYTITGIAESAVDSEYLTLQLDPFEGSIAGITTPVPGDIPAFSTTDIVTIALTPLDQTGVSQVPQILSGMTAPADTLGRAGDFYFRIDMTVDPIVIEFFGPKTSVWDTGTSIVGIHGIDGDKGDQGFQGIYNIEIFLEAATQPDTPTGGAITDGVLTTVPIGGWSLEFPNTFTTLLWQAVFAYNPADPALPIIWSITYEAGAQGPTGLRGPAAGVGTPTTTTIPANLDGTAGTATVTTSGPDSATVFEFGIPAGPTGETGEAGGFGTPTVETVPLNEDGTIGIPTIDATGPDTAKVFDFGLPIGLTGEKGDIGVTGNSLTITNVVPGSGTMDTTFDVQIVDAEGDPIGAPQEVTAPRGPEGDDGDTPIISATSTRDGTVTTIVISNNGEAITTFTLDDGEAGDESLNQNIIVTAPLTGPRGAGSNGDVTIGLEGVLLEPDLGDNTETVLITVVDVDGVQTQGSVTLASIMGATEFIIVPTASETFTIANDQAIRIGIDPFVSIGDGQPVVLDPEEIWLNVSGGTIDVTFGADLRPSFPTGQSIREYTNTATGVQDNLDTLVGNVWARIGRSEEEVIALDRMLILDGLIGSETDENQPANRIYFSEDLSGTNPITIRVSGEFQQQHLSVQASATPVGTAENSVGVYTRDTNSGCLRLTDVVPASYITTIESALQPGDIGLTSIRYGDDPRALSQDWLTGSFNLVNDDVQINDVNGVSFSSDVVPGERLEFIVPGGTNFLLTIARTFNISAGSTLVQFDEELPNDFVQGLTIRAVGRTINEIAIAGTDIEVVEVNGVATINYTGISGVIANWLIFVPFSDFDMTTGQAFVAFGSIWYATADVSLTDESTVDAAGLRAVAELTELADEGLTTVATDDTITGDGATTALSVANPLPTDNIAQTDVSSVDGVSITVGTETFTPTDNDTTYTGGTDIEITAANVINFNGATGSTIHDQNDLADNTDLTIVTGDLVIADIFSTNNGGKVFLRVGGSIDINNSYDFTYETVPSGFSTLDIDPGWIQAGNINLDANNDDVDADSQWARNVSMNYTELNLAGDDRIIEPGGIIGLRSAPAGAGVEATKFMNISGGPIQVQRGDFIVSDSDNTIIDSVNATTWFRLEKLTASTASGLSIDANFNTIIIDNPFTDGDETKLDALPTRAELTAEIAAKVVNSVTVATTGSTQSFNVGTGALVIQSDVGDAVVPPHTRAFGGVLSSPGSQRTDTNGNTFTVTIPSSEITTGFTYSIITATVDDTTNYTATISGDTQSVSIVNSGGVVGNTRVHITYTTTDTEATPNTVETIGPVARRLTITAIPVAVADFRVGFDTEATIAAISDVDVIQTPVAGNAEPGEIVITTPLPATLSSYVYFITDPTVTIRRITVEGFRSTFTSSTVDGFNVLRSPFAYGGGGEYDVILTY